MIPNIFFTLGQRTDENGARKPLIKISYKSDVWSLGCILYNLAYGKMPFGDIKIPVMKLQVCLYDLFFLILFV